MQHPVSQVITLYITKSSSVLFIHLELLLLRVTGRREQELNKGVQCIWELWGLQAGQRTVLGRCLA